MEIAVKLLRGKYGLAKTFWLFWFLPSVLFGILLSPEFYIPFLIKLNSISYYTAAALAFSVPIIFILYNAVMMIASWSAANSYSGLRLWSILAKIYIAISLIAICYGFYIALSSDNKTENSSNKTLPIEGYWQTNCSDNSGILFTYAGDMEFSVQFCSGIGCSDPGKYKPNTSIINDPDYKIIDGTHMYINDHYGFRKYTLCQ